MFIVVNFIWEQPLKYEEGFCLVKNEKHLAYCSVYLSGGFLSVQISMTEVLGCKEGCCDPSSQTELTKDGPSSSSKPSSWYDGPNSYETLLFAPRY